METPYSMKDILKFRKAAYLAAKVSGEENFALTQFCEETKPLLSAHLSKHSFSELARFFEPYLKGLTIETMEKINACFYEELYRRRKEKERFRPMPETRGRLYPLGKQAYEHFAKYVWEKRGGYVSTKGHFGCVIRENLRGKKFIKISITHQGEGKNGSSD